VTGLQGGIGSINTRYPESGDLQLLPAADGVKLTPWRGERVNAQIVTFATDASDNSVLILFNSHPPCRTPSRSPPRQLRPLCSCQWQTAGRHP